MKIVDVETLVCNARMRNWVFVKVITDQPGLIGWGEATLEWHTRAVCGAIDDMRPLLVGEDPERITHLWQSLYRQHFWHSHGIVRLTAISAIDIALWDIAGKLRNVPCYKLLGGAVRDKVRLYCHLGGGRMESFYDVPVSDAERFADLAQEAVENGYSAMKCMAVPPTMSIEGNRPVREAVTCVEAILERVGPEVDLMVDCHARPSPQMGLRFAKALEHCDLYFLEEPCWPESVDGLVRISEAVVTPIATGERLTAIEQFKQVVDSRGAAVLQPDITHCGGITGVRRVAALADSARLTLAPHNPQGPVSTAASIQIGFSEPSYVICESVHNDVPWRQDVVSEGWAVDESSRTIACPESPGLGIELNEHEIKRHPFKQELEQRVFYADGSVGDW